MICPIDLLADLQSPLVVRTRLRQLPQILEHPGEVAEVDSDIRVIHAIDLLVDHQSPLVVRTRLRQLPQILEHAGAYMEIRGRSFRHYLGLIQAHQAKLLAWLPQDASDDIRAVATTWTVSIEQAAKATPAAADLLTLCAFLAPDDIPRWLLTDHADELPEPLKTTVQDAFELDEALGALRRYSLIEMGEETLSAHRMVQAVVRGSLPDEDRNQWAATALRLVNAAFPFDSNDVRTWDICTPLLPHALAVLERVGDLDEVANETANLLNNTGLFFRGRAEYAEARSHYERALEIDEQVYGADHPQVAIDLNNLAGVLQDLGELAQARSHFERALEISEQVYGADHPNVAVDLQRPLIVRRRSGW